MSLLLRCKVALLGDAAVGKSSMMQMLHSKNASFPRTYKMTSGAELVVFPMEVADEQGHAATVQLHIFDVGGQEIFRESVFKYLENVSMVILAYDTTSAKSFENCEKWLQLLKKCRGDRPILGSLVGCKMDLTERKAIATETVQEFAETNGLRHFECSAAPPGRHVAEPFLFLAKSFHASYEAVLGKMNR